MLKYEWENRSSYFTVYQIVFNVKLMQPSSVKRTVITWMKSKHLHDCILIMSQLSFRKSSTAEVKMFILEFISICKRTLQLCGFIGLHCHCYSVTFDIRSIMPFVPCTHINHLTWGHRRDIFTHPYGNFIVTFNCRHWINATKFTARI